MHTESLDLSLLSHENAAEVLSSVEYLIDIKSLNLGGDETNDLTFDDVAAFEEAFPDAEFSYDFTLFGKPYSVNTKKVNLSQVKMDDNGEAVRAALRCMKKCDYLDMDSCGVDSEHKAAIRDEFPQIEVVWRVFFGDNYTARTNTDRILASAWNGGGELGYGNVGWRVDEDEYGNKSWNPRYYELRELFGYKNSPYCYNYTFNDPYCYSPYPTPPEN